MAQEDQGGGGAHEENTEGNTEVTGEFNTEKTNAEKNCSIIPIIRLIIRTSGKTRM